MNSHQRKKLRKKQDILRRIHGITQTDDDQWIRDSFATVIRRLLDLNTNSFHYNWYVIKDLGVSYKIERNMEKAMYVYTSTSV